MAENNALEEENVQDNRLERLRRATCLIQAGECNATGFHFGRGWIMTVAHIFQDDDDPDYFHSVLPGARFVFDGQQNVFAIADNRLGFIHHLTPGDAVDPINMDIAMVKLGRQIDGDRNAPGNWDQNEQRQLDELNLESFGNIHEREVAIGDEVSVIYNTYNSDANDYIRNIEVRTVTGKTEAKITLQPAITGAISGAPILKNNSLVGILYAGDNDTNDAIPWNRIFEYIHSGVGIMADVERYMQLRNIGRQVQAQVQAQAQAQASKLRRELEQQAGRNRLTIYLVGQDGPEIIEH